MKGHRGSVLTHVLRFGTSGNGRKLSHAIAIGGSWWRTTLVVLLSALPLLQAHATTYSYDAAGRLKSATNSQGQTATYDYDSRGNLIRIERSQTSQLAIYSFTPNNGSPGVQVTINGSGFDPITSNDAVAFNGTPAPVVAASDTQLLVQVPQNATTGPISVSTGAGTATSDDTFYITTAGDSPVISSFTPSAGSLGTTVTLSGQHLDPVPGETIVTISGLYIPVASISDVQISFAIPAWIGSGPISVTTPYGVASTATPFYFIPAGVSQTTVSQNPPLTVGAAATQVGFTTALPNSEFTFQGTAGDYISLQASGFSDGSWVGYQVYSPSGALFANGSIGASSASAHLPRLPALGNYTVLLNHSSAFQFALAVQRDPVLADNGVSVSASTAVYSQSLRYVLNEAAGANLGLGVTNITTTNVPGSVLSVVIYSPDGSSWMSSSCGGCDFNLTNLANTPQEGAYTVVVSPNGNQGTFGFTATLSKDVVVAVPMNGTPTSLNTSVVGQNGWMTFTNDTPLQQAALNISTSTTPSGSQVNYRIYYPNGSLAWNTGDGGYWPLPSISLTQVGTYRIFIDPTTAASSVVTASVIADPSTSPIPVNGAPVNLSTSVSGQSQTFTFAANQGDNLSMAITGMTLSAPATSIAFTVFRPDGTNWQSITCSGACKLNLTNASQTGTYSVVARPNYSYSYTGGTMNFTAAVSLDAGPVTLPMDGTTATVSTSRVGQNAWLTFTNSTPFQQGVLNISASTTPASTPVNYRIYNPDGSLAWSTGDGGSWPLPDITMTQVGTYRIFVDPTMSTASTVTATLTANPAGGVLAVNGAPISVTTTANGQNASFTFSANQGDNLALSLTNVTRSINGGWIGVNIVRPDGTNWSGWTSSGQCGNCALNLTNAPETGTYTVQLTPLYSYSYVGGTMSFTATLTQDAGPVTVPMDGTTATVSTNSFGQNAWMTFSNSIPSQQAVLSLSTSIAPAGTQNNIRIYNPDGSLAWSTGDGGWWPLPNITMTQVGTYRIFIDPTTATSTVTTATLITNPLAGTATTNGTPLGIATAQSGQIQTVDFIANQGDNLDLAIRNLTFSITNAPNLWISIIRPDGANWITPTCNSSCDINLRNAPLSGDYKIVMTPEYSYNYIGGTFSASLTLSGDMAPVALPSDGTPQSLSISGGTNGWFSFSNTTPYQQASLAFSGISTTPASQTVALTIYNPDGSVLASGSPTSSQTFNWTLVQAGTYRVYVDPGLNSANITAALTLGQVSTPTPPSGSAPGSFQTSQSGQAVPMVFTANQGDNLGLAITSLTTSGVPSNQVTVNVLKPDGTSWTSAACTAPACSFNLKNAPITGTYGITVTPNGNQGTMSFTATVSPDVGPVAVPADGTPTTMSITTQGQNGWFSFSNSTPFQQVALQLSGIATTPANQTVAVYLYNPDGSQITSATPSSSQGFNLTLAQLGTYKVYVDPGLNTASITAALIGNPSAGALTAGSSPTSFSTSLNNQTESFTFSANKGDNLGLAITNVTTVGVQSNQIQVSIAKPDGTTWTSAGCTAAGCAFNLASAPLPGTYTVTVTPNGGAGTFGFTATLSQDVGPVAIPFDGTPASLSINTVAQNGWFSFNNPTPLQQAVLFFSSISTTPSGQGVGITIYNPDGSRLNANTLSSPTSFNLSLLQTGIYKIYVDPGLNSANVTAALITNPGGGSVVVGTPANLATTLSGQSEKFTFNANQGDNLGLTISNMALSGVPSNNINISIVRPDGTTWASSSCNTGCSFNLQNVPFTGTYTVTLVPNSGLGTFSFTATLFQDVAPVALPWDGTPTTLSMAAGGQNGWFAFTNNTPFQQATLCFSSIATTPSGQGVGIYVYNPDGSLLVSSGLSAPQTYNLTLQLGTYRIYVDPGLNAASVTASLIANASGTVTAGGAPLNVATAVSGQSTKFTLLANQGDNLNLAITNISVTNNLYNQICISITRPDGVVWSNSCYGAGNQNFGFFSAPLTGTYVVNAWPNNNQGNIANQGTFSFTATLTNFALVNGPASLSIDGGPTTLSTGASGQAAFLNFGNGGALQPVALQFSGIATAPLGEPVVLTVFNPDGSTLWQDATTEASDIAYLMLIQPGTYVVSVAAVQSTFSATVSVTSQ